MVSSPLTPEQRVVHVLNRTSFGPTRSTVERLTRVGRLGYLDEQLRPEEISDSLLESKVTILKSTYLRSRSGAKFTSLQTGP